MPRFPELPFLPEPPIVVEASAKLRQVESLIGQLIPLVSGAVVALAISGHLVGWVPFGLMTAIGNMVWRLVRAARHHAELKRLAAAAPDSVGVVLPLKKS
jgi:hypothetical protein